VTTAIIRELQKLKTPTILDIGANIGLITLNILRYSDVKKIYAFEPGAHEYKLLTKTLKYNNLDRKVSAVNLALADFDGEASFAAHSTTHSSGDGRRDTNSAGASKTLTVTVQQLGNWWTAQNSPHMHFIKIDTEGAELLVLKGPQKLLKQCQ